RFTYTDRARVALALGDVDLAEQVLDAVREPIARIGDPRRGRGRAPRAGGVRGCARGFGGRRCSAGGRPGGCGVRRVRGVADGAGTVTGRCRAYGGCTSADRRDRSVG